ncbi:uncharacterized protein LOC117905435 [Vitis riparia]|uniref:uncharacterized protein LOC117905435 n=1 Tax=Vitis riparia TaxID=96939 RepID=UPI00155A5197|nr:uncharacterized protein LOC117905435 [Vitis riparia]
MTHLFSLMLIGSGRFLDWKAVNAEGASGGIFICWDKRTLDIIDWEEGQFTLSCRFRNVENGIVWAFTGVYGPFSKMERNALWEEFGAIRGLWEDPWCIGGDFNITLFPRERSRQRRISAAMRKFAETVNDLGLVDLPLQGGECTWKGGQNNQTWARLDRFLVSPCWLDQFSGINQWRLPRPVSDHFPIMLVGGGIRRGPTPFRFENMWLKAEGFKELVRSWWQGIDVRGSASYKLATKMKEIKKKLKVWNREVFGKLESNKSEALQQVDFWDREEEERVLTVEETELKKEAKENYRKWVMMEETHWRQLSREIWLKEGDRNTGFFHRMASAHRRNNSLERIKINGEWLLEEQEIREGIANAFKNFLSEDKGWKADIGGIQLEQISHQEAENLERPFSEDEIHAALMEMNGDKAPGPDGFTLAFWQSCWEFIKEEIIEMFKEFYEHSSFLKSLNNTFLVLIPKKSFFPSSKGLRQGDPLSPYLFVMGMEVLDVLIRRAVEGGFLSGCIIRGGSEPSLSISHLFFADDTIIFCEARKEHLTHLSWILFWFEAASGLRINLAKSEIIPVGEVVEMEELAVELGCRVGSLPSQYLGLPLGAPNKAPYMWDGVEERVRRRLALWKRQYISKGGRVTLIKSTLASMPIYQMSIFRMPKIVARRLEKVQRDFLWEGEIWRGKFTW